MKKRLKVIVPIFLAVCFVAVWGFRFHTVNAETKPTPVKVYKMGEPAPYEKDFFHFADEGLEGYVLTVKSAKLMTYKDFVELHGQTEDFIPKNEIRPTYVYDVEVYIQNHKTEDKMKGIDLVNSRLVSANASMQVNSRLFGLLYPHLDGNMVFSLNPNSDMTMHLPYAEYEETSKEKLLSRDYSLLMTMYPTKKMIEIKPTD